MIVLGGSMGAYEEFAHPWLIDEKCWIAQVVGAQVPLLGICLGRNCWPTPPVGGHTGPRAG